MACSLPSADPPIDPEVSGPENGYKTEESCFADF
jgi:hypothetical protein